MFCGEMQLLGWREDHNSGAKVNLALAAPDDLEPFKSMTVKKGKMAGQVLACLMVEVLEDETWEEALARAAQTFAENLPLQDEERGRLGVEEAARLPAAQHPKGGQLCRLAAMWCQDVRFHTWLQQQGFLTFGKVMTSDAERAEWAAETIRRVCGITSRAELDSDPEAAATFHETFRRPFSAHLASLGE